MILGYQESTSGLEKTVDDGGEAEPSEVGGHGNSGGWNFEGSIQLRNETYLDPP